VDYLAKLRIEKARELLLKTQLNIDTIAEQVGHVNKAYFSKVFKKFTGVTPGEYRKAPTIKQQL
jgi:YesN/AraC family two-component response regulator